MNIETDFDRKTYWEKIYQTKQPGEVSWHEEVPATSLELIKRLNLPKTARIFDNGSGDSFLVDYLLKLGYVDITVQDISETALNRTKQRLGKDAEKIKWIVGDEAHCNPAEQYDLWHDRAAFHFLTDESEIQSYVNTIKKCIKPGGYFIIATFSEKGPKTCSGLPVTQYSESSMTRLLEDSFDKVECFTIDHHTPNNKVQNFLYCIFKRNSKNQALEI
jgi:SAM-dependent methyltransferase